MRQAVCRGPFGVNVRISAATAMYSPQWQVQ